jgi:arylsulfatase A
VRRGPWKLHLKTINPAAGEKKPKVHNPPLLFNLALDPSERLNVTAQHAEMIQQLLKVIEKHRQDVKPGIPQS